MGNDQDLERAMLQELKEIKEILNGKDGRLGLVAKVNVIWSTYIWILCSASAGVGAFLTWLANRHV